MKLTLIIGLLAAGWLLVRHNSTAAKARVPAEEAAAKLREAWADNHAA